MSLHEAQASLARLRDTEPDAARALLAAGPVTNFTLEQAPVTDSIAALLHEGSTPTRVLVRDRALETARAAMRPGDGDAPDVYSVEADLPPRIVSPSAKVHAALWLDRMDATPPPTGLLHDRITCLEHAARLMGDAAREHARTHRAAARPMGAAVPSRLTDPHVTSPTGNGDGELT